MRETWLQRKHPVLLATPTKAWEYVGGGAPSDDKVRSSIFAGQCDLRGRVY